MSFRRAALERIGGIRDGYRGTCIREETDLCLQVTAAGYRLVYAPDAVVEHVAAPYAKGSRFDLRYAYWAQKNHLILLIRHFGSSAARSCGATSPRRPRVSSGTVRNGPAGPGAAPVIGTSPVQPAPRRVAPHPAVLLAATVSGLSAGVRMERHDRRGR